MAFVKLWDNILDNIKVQQLPAPLFKAWVNLLVTVTRYGGVTGELPPWEDLCFALRADRQSVESWVAGLVTAGLIDPPSENRHYSLHDWNKWNESRDPGAAKRQREWRRRNALRNAMRNGACNAPQVLEGMEGKNINLPLTPSFEGDEKSTDPPEPKPAKRQRPPDQPEHVAVIELAAKRWGVKSGPPVVRRLLRSYRLECVTSAVNELWRIAGTEPFDRRRLEGICRSIESGRWMGGRTSFADRREERSPYEGWTVHRADPRNKFPGSTSEAS